MLTPYTKKPDLLVFSSSLMYGFHHTGKLISVQPPGVFTSKQPPGVYLRLARPTWSCLVKPENPNFWVILKYTTVLKIVLIVDLSFKTIRSPVMTQLPN